nr:energy-coupling factor transporter ATPase [Clostridia bacterium]
MSPKRPIISFQEVTFRYDRDDPVPALESFSVDIDKGSFVAVIGSNGSGKSTFAKLSNGISLPDSGKVFVDGLDTSDENNDIAVRRKIGLVFQDPDNQIVSSIVEDDVAFGPENLGLPIEEIRERVDYALKAVGMYDLRFKEPSMLSGGQKQRIAIAGMIAMRPDCLVLDEPTAMLDPKGRKEVLQTLTELNRGGMTVVLITHFMQEACLADRVIVINNARIVSDGSPETIFSDRDSL